MKSLFYFLKTPNYWLQLSFILLIVFIFNEKSMFAQSQARVIVAGAGTVAVNGTYKYSRMINSRPCFVMGIYKVEYRDGGFGLEWEIWDTTEVRTDYEIKYFNASTGNTPPTNTWSVDVASPPAPVFSYIDIPVVTTNTTSSITSTSVISGGNITSDGGSTVTERGIVYSSTDVTPTIGETNVTQVTGGSGTGNYNILINSLLASTKYYVRAYATNIAGTAYGSILDFTTAIATYTGNITDEKLIIHPNPTTDGFYINLDKRTQVIIYDLRGNALITQFVNGNSFINMSKFPSGLYLVKLGNQTIKLLKK